MGGTTEAVDVEAEDVATSEMAFVQVKSQAGQTVLDKYVQTFRERREQYDRMFFAVHTLTGSLIAPADERVHIWDGERIAGLAVQLGLGAWIANRL